MRKKRDKTTTTTTTTTTSTAATTTDNDGNSLFRQLLRRFSNKFKVLIKGLPWRKMTLKVCNTTLDAIR